MNHRALPFPQITDGEVIAQTAKFFNPKINDIKNIVKINTVTRFCPVRNRAETCLSLEHSNRGIDTRYETSVVRVQSKSYFY